MKKKTNTHSHTRDWVLVNTQKHFTSIEKVSIFPERKIFSGLWRLGLPKLSEGVLLEFWLYVNFFSMHQDLSTPVSFIIFHSAILSKHRKGEAEADGPFKVPGTKTQKYDFVLTRYVLTIFRWGGHLPMT